MQSILPLQGNEKVGLLLGAGLGFFFSGTWLTLIMKMQGYYTEPFNLLHALLMMFLFSLTLGGIFSKRLTPNKAYKVVGIFLVGLVPMIAIYGGWFPLIVYGFIVFGVFKFFLINKIAYTYKDQITKDKKVSDFNSEVRDIKDAIGDSQFATISDVAKAVDADNNQGRRDLRDGLNIINQVYWSGQGHILTVGAPRQGKGTTVILPALTGMNLKFQYAPSLFVFDPKGENLNESGDYLINCGYQVYCVNPFGIPEIERFGNSRFNPFDLIDLADEDEANEIIKDISMAIVPVADDPKGEFFRTGARNMIQMFMKHMVTQNRDPKNFRTLYRYIHASGTDLSMLVGYMMVNKSFDGMVSEYGRSLGQKSAGTGGGINSDILQNAQNFISDFVSNKLGRSMAESDFNFNQLGAEKVAIFICTKPESLDGYEGWARLIFGSALKSVQRRHTHDHKIFFIIDELPALGYMKQIDRFLGFGAQYATLWAVCQNLGQLKALYPNTWENFVGNAKIIHWLIVTDSFTAEYVSKRLPETVKIIGSPSSGSPRYEKRPLMTSQEITKMKDHCIVEMSGLVAPALVRKVPFWEQIKANQEGAQ